MKVLYLVPDDRYFWTHRRGLALAAKEAGAEVVVAVPKGVYSDRIESLGVRLEPVSLRRTGGMRQAWRGFWSVLRMYRRERPDVVHHVSMRAVLAGSLAARFTGVPCRINLVTGLGSVFESRRGLLKRGVLWAYRFLLFGSKGGMVVFQNPEDRSFFLDHGLVEPGQTTLIPGSGVDLTDLKRRDRQPPDPVVVVCAARLIADKGIRELVGAVRLLRQGGAAIRLWLVGDPDPGNPTSLTETELRSWQEDGLAELWGWREDIPQVLAQAHIACLPSYREGLPKFLLEAAAVGLPIVTTDVPGCRSCVQNNGNGLLVPARNVDLLADALSILMKNRDLREKMGGIGRSLVEQSLSQAAIIKQTLALYPFSAAATSQAASMPESQNPRQPAVGEPHSKTVFSSR